MRYQVTAENRFALLVQANKALMANYLPQIQSKRTFTQAQVASLAKQGRIIAFRKTAIEIDKKDLERIELFQKSHQETNDALQDLYIEAKQTGQISAETIAALEDSARGLNSSIRLVPKYLYVSNRIKEIVGWLQRIFKFLKHEISEFVKMEAIIVNDIIIKPLKELWKVTLTINKKIPYMRKLKRRYVYIGIGAVLAVMVAGGLVFLGAANAEMIKRLEEGIRSIGNNSAGMMKEVIEGVKEIFSGFVAKLSAVPKLKPEYLGPVPIQKPSLTLL